MTEDQDRAVRSADAGDRLRDNDGSRASRLPATPDDREVSGRPTRRAVLDFFNRRYGIPRKRFSGHTFWEKGAGRVWAFGGALPSPQAVEAVGLPIVRVRQPHWKPTTVGAQRFGEQATKNVLSLGESEANRFLRGDDLTIDWDGEWGYLFVAHELGEREPIIGVGLYVHGELQSMVPKGRRRDRQ